MSSTPAAAFPPELACTEEHLLELRRRAVNLPGGHTPDTPALVGLALSGGGIRSATFSLGVLQSLARHDLLKRVDYLSTVSGGGYIGTFLAAQFARAKASAQSVRDTLNPDHHPESPELDWLRRNGRYLAPNGGADLIPALAAGLRNWAAVFLVVSLTLLLLLLGLDLLPSKLGTLWVPPLVNELRAGFPKEVALDLGTAGRLCMELSPWLSLLTPVALLIVVPLGWGYWAIGPLQRGLHPSYALLLVAAVAQFSDGSTHALLRELALTVSGLALALAAVARWLPPVSNDEARRRLTQWLGSGLMLLAGLALLGVVDTLGEWVRKQAAGGQTQWLAALSLLSAAATLASQKVSALRKLMSWAFSDRKISLPASVLMWAAALIAALSLAVLISAAAQALSATDQSAAIWFLLLLISWLIGRTWSFVNRSSHHALYAARLKRTYLGASNPERHEKNSKPVTEPLTGDDFEMRDYWSDASYQAGAPLHLINVTINQTVSRRQGTVNRDRKGIPLAVGPGGFSAGVQHHFLEPSVQGSHRPASQAKGYWMFEGSEPPVPTGFWGRLWDWFKQPILASRGYKALSVGQWVAISGAAFSTGTGYHTSMAGSLLTGLANVRLGYWWRSGAVPKFAHQERWNPGRRVSRELRRLLPVQMHLLDELTARFHGPGEPYWYLSDGGHFENMGGYELIRRRLPVMIVVDGEADPDYRYEGLAGLVRKARTDFGAEIDFLDRERLDQLFGNPEASSVFGTLEDLRPEGEDRYSKAHAALAEVRYSDEPGRRSLLIYLKPTLQTDVPADVREYQQRNPPFPQQPTLDQFFDEVQWESYRRLGLYVGDKVWRLQSRTGWSPGSLNPPWW